MLTNLLDAPVRTDQLGRVGEVDAVEAGTDDRRRRDAHVNLCRARVEEHLHDLPRRVPADDRVVDGHDPLTCKLGQRVELQLDALLAQPLLRLDERAADVAVLDQALAERDSGRAGEADRRGRARVGDRQDEIGVDRRLCSEPLAHSNARAVHLDVLEVRVGAGQVEELEDAERAVLRRLDRLDRSQAVRVDEDELPGRDLALEGAPTRSSAQVSDATTHWPSSRPSASGRKPNGSRNAISVPSERATIEYAPSSLAIAPATASSSGAESLVTSAAINSLSEVERSFTPSSASCARNSAAFVRLPLCPSAIVLAAPWWINGCALSQRVEPVVE